MHMHVSICLLYVTTLSTVQYTIQLDTCIHVRNVVKKFSFNIIALFTHTTKLTLMLLATPPYFYFDTYGLYLLASTMLL